MAREILGYDWPMEVYGREARTSYFQSFTVYPTRETMFSFLLVLKPGLTSAERKPLNNCGCVGFKIEMFKYHSMNAISIFL